MKFLSTIKKETLLLSFYLLILFSFQANAQNIDLRISANEFIEPGQTELDLNFTLSNFSENNYSDFEFVSDLYNWKSNELIADLGHDITDIDPNGNSILDAGETWSFNLYQQLDAELSNMFVLNGAIAAIDQCGNLETTGDAKTIKVTGVNMDVAFGSDCVTAGDTLDVMLITRLLIDEDAAKNPGSTIINAGGIDIEIPLPQTRWEARDLMITVEGLNGDLAFDPFNPPAGLGITNFCDQGGVDAGRNSGNVLDECEPIETVRAPCSMFGEDDILCEYPDWVFCYQIPIPEDFADSYFTLTASDDFLVFFAEENPPSSGIFGDFLDISNTIETGGADTDSIEVKPASVIPVELVDFDAEKAGENALLTWSTASEINNSHFEIERRLNDGSFEVIGRVEGKGTTTNITEYSFTDDRTGKGLNYYRLAQYDYDGSFDRSEVRLVDFRIDFAKVDVTVYPNPTIEYIAIKSNADLDEVGVVIFSADGQVVMQTNAALDSEINMNNLPEGMYTVRVTDGNNQIISTQKITKLRN